MDQMVQGNVSARVASSSGQLLRWWHEGARSALFLRPRWTDLQPTPSLIAWLVIVPNVIGIVLQRLIIDGPATFYWPALQVGWLSTVVAVWVCWLMASPVSLTSSSHTSLPAAPSTASLFGLLSAQLLTIYAVLTLVMVPVVRGGYLARSSYADIWTWGLFVLPVLWIMAVQVKTVWQSSKTGWLPRLTAVIALPAVMLFHQLVQPLQVWYADPSPLASAASEPLVLTQELFESQQELLTRQLEALPTSRSHRMNVYAITFAPYEGQEVFRRESQLVTDVIASRFDAQRRSIQLVNHKDTVSQLPWATALNLQRTIKAMAGRMNRDEDVLFIHLTSHGAKDGKLATQFWPLTLSAVTPQDLRRWLDEAGVKYRVLSISACYSGSWLEPLEDEGTLVMTAADASHTSYGCGSKSDLTYFGRAMYDEEMRQTRSFEDAHTAARLIIDKREREVGKADGYSNPQLRIGLLAKVHLANLAGQFDKKVRSEDGK